MKNEMITWKMCTHKATTKFWLRKKLIILAYNKIVLVYDALVTSKFFYGLPNEIIFREK